MSNMGVNPIYVHSSEVIKVQCVAPCNGMSYSPSAIYVTTCTSCKCQ